jgi:hypothetical protein
MQYIPATHKYIPRIEQRQENLFTEEYYSSTDTKIYIDDEEQTEIGYISYSLQEQLKPLYGYNSNTWDEVAIGNRIVTGTIKIPIKNPQEQTPLEDIVSAYNSDDPEWLKYNMKEDKDFSNNEWINPSNDRIPYTPDYNTKETVNPYSKDGKQDGDTITLTYNKAQKWEDLQTYVPKLNKLGYNVSITDSTRIANIVKDFQNSIGREPTGILDTFTKQQIDYLTDNSKNIEIPRGTAIYSGPGTSYEQISITDRNSNAKVINTNVNLDNWTMVEFSDKVRGYVNINGT